MQKNKDLGTYHNGRLKMDCRIMLVPELQHLCFGTKYTPKNARYAKRIINPMPKRMNRNFMRCVYATPRATRRFFTSVGLMA
jgi:hypothetical protein